MSFRLVLPWKRGPVQVPQEEKSMEAGAHGRSIDTR